jgi:hypothetical protein
MKLNIPKHLNQLTFENLSHTYNSNDDVIIILPQNISLEEMREMALFLLSQAHSDLRNLLLADLVEADNFPCDLIEDVFSSGDTGCRVAVCLRNDLSDRLTDLCFQSNDENVLSHLTHKSQHDNAHYKA